MGRPIRSSAPRFGSRRGLSLLEVLVALAVLGICMIFMTQLLVQEAFIERRTSTQTAALRLLEAHAELFRAGLSLPEEDGRFPMELLVEPPVGSGLAEPKIVFVVQSLEPPGLRSLDLELSYRVAQQPRRLAIEMRLWRP